MDLLAVVILEAVVFTQLFQSAHELASEDPIYSLYRKEKLLRKTAVELLLIRCQSAT